MFTFWFRLKWRRHTHTHTHRESEKLYTLIGTGNHARRALSEWQAAILLCLVALRFFACGLCHLPTLSLFVILRCLLFGPSAANKLKGKCSFIPTWTRVEIWITQHLITWSRSAEFWIQIQNFVLRQLCHTKDFKKFAKLQENICYLHLIIYVNFHYS